MRGVLLGLLLLAGCSGKGDPTAGSRPDPPVKPTPQAPPAPIVFGPFPVGESFVLGNARVTVKRAMIDGFYSRSAGGDVFHQAELLIHLELRPVDSTRLSDAAAQSGVAKLTDDVGNQYQNLVTSNEFGSPTVLDGQIPRKHSVRLRGDAVASDVLVFEKPVPAAKWLTLTLDGASYGGAGTTATVAFRASDVRPGYMKK